jgi:hypothetical protein
MGRTAVRLAKLCLILGFGVGAGCGEANVEDFNEEVIACEEAVAHLESCCGSLDGDVRCVHVAPTYYRESSCDAPVATSMGESPDIGSGWSRCYRALSCTRIRERGDCEAFRGTVPFTSSPCE